METSARKESCRKTTTFRIWRGRTRSETATRKKSSWKSMHAHNVPTNGNGYGRGTRSGRRGDVSKESCLEDEEPFLVLKNVCSKGIVSEVFTGCGLTTVCVCSKESCLEGDAVRAPLASD